MGQLNGSKIYKAIKGLFSALDSTDESLLKAIHYQHKVRVYVSDLATAGTAQTATPFYTNDTGGNMRVISCKLIVPIAVTANATTNMTATVAKVDAAGSNSATIASYTSDVAGGSLTAFVPKALTLTAANVVVANGWTLNAAVSKGSTGVAFTAATSQAYIEVILEPEA